MSKTLPPNNMKIDYLIPTWRNSILIIFCLILIGATIWICFCVNNETRTHEYDYAKRLITTVEKTASIHSPQENQNSKEKTVLLSQSEIENLINTSAYLARQEVKEDYHSYFSTLLTVITIAGICFPIIMWIMEHLLHQIDMHKLQEAINKSETGLQNAQEATEKLNKMKKEINDCTKEVYEAYTNANQSLELAEKAVEQSNNTLQLSERILDTIEQNRNDMFILMKRNLKFIASLYEEKQCFSTVFTIRIDILACYICMLINDSSYFLNNTKNEFLNFSSKLISYLEQNENDLRLTSGRLKDDLNRIKKMKNRLLKQSTEKREECQEFISAIDSIIKRINTVLSQSHSQNQSSSNDSFDKNIIAKK